MPRSPSRDGRGPSAFSTVSTKGGAFIPQQDIARDQNAGAMITLMNKGGLLEDAHVEARV